MCASPWPPPMVSAGHDGLMDHGNGTTSNIEACGMRRHVASPGKCPRAAVPPGHERSVVIVITSRMQRVPTVKKINVICIPASMNL
jgi:hypothetical protein